MVFIAYTVRVPAAFVLVFWFAMQLLSSYLAGEQEGGVAFGAHIGGFVVGMVLIPFFRHRDKPLHLPWKRF